VLPIEFQELCFYVGNTIEISTILEYTITILARDGTAERAHCEGKGKGKGA
jgi:hypothetical protein